MEIKNEIRICLGSSCFARGNKHTVQVIKNYLASHQLNDTIYFHGAHCFGNCVNGPCIEINNVKYENITADAVISLIQKHFPV